ncbi:MULTISPECIES: NAD(P)/FAD-dependent oxidoreductase [Pseudomonas syringae group]|uniref:FAD-binding oxidoreductase n=3 Tax=Pseudomonas syringae group TaxID=136849 RepID=A0AAW4E7T3_PSESX|nr:MULTISPECIES: FAD-binding oxidoreductase [Pseudomonas syringae group]AVI84725.1 oxidoreductase [Pseudomonas syringae pv. tomato]EEB58395.1 FAD dependent oxidoreductase [Pseudomonas syringae pv. tomato T1]KGK93564.1 oxidoreductase [Pseudomonas syringae pv. tomato]KUR41107.1 Gamma-glutamylputrescine oxidoreductase [Pseudomonas syringae pv. tomato]KUR51888.1 Gamma-glutamylputrescine oxidoreductase [Pseudomonas syringae pv. tomato]
MNTHSIKRLPVDTGVSGWEAISTRSTPVRTLDGSVTADWLIIGAGFAGLSAARRLAQLRPQDRIVLVDAHEVAKGPAGRNSGFMIDVPHSLSSGEYSVAGDSATTREIAQNRFAIGFAAQAARDYGMSAETFDPSGKINAAATERGERLNSNYARSLKGIGEGFELFDAAQMREITGSTYYHSGLYTPGAVMIQPAQYIRDLAAGLDAHISLYERSPIVELSRSGADWTARSHHGAVTAPKVILAVNGHIEDFGHFKDRLLHVFTYASMTAGYRDDEFKRGATGRERWALLPADPMGATVRKITMNGLSRIVIRTKFTYDPSIQVTSGRVAEVAKEQRHSLDARFPELNSTALEFSWAGRLCLSMNSAPAFGEIEENLYSACCENGLGTVKSTLAGVMAAELATATKSKFLDDFCDTPGPSKLPPKILTRLGVSSVISWQALRAGREG